MREVLGMKNKYLKNLNRIEFVVTMACTGHCKHCSEGEHCSNGEHIDGDVAAQAISDICQQYQIESVMTFGGEPLLYPEVVCKIHETARKYNIPQRDLITNGFFSKNIDRINEVAAMLAKSGVSYIMLSVDAFHQENIPIEYVKAFAQAAIKEGINIQAHPAWLVSTEDDNCYNLQTRAILEEFHAMGVTASDGNIIFPSGNAKKYLAKYFDGEADPVSPYEDDPKDVQSVSFSPNGDVLQGNIYRHNIMDILDSYIPCPEFTTKSFTFRLVQEGDSKSLFRCYNDKKAVSYMNDDNCDFGFFVETEEKMRETIVYWLDFYRMQAFTRFAIVLTDTGEAVGTVEGFCGDTGVLRVDIESDFEKESYLSEIFNMAAQHFKELFGNEYLVTKAVSEAVNRRNALTKSGWDYINQYREYDDYYKLKL